MAEEPEDPRWDEESDEDEDWIKTLSWDLPTDLEGLLGAIGTGRNDTPDNQQRLIEDFFDLPAAQAMPAYLQKQLAEYLRVLRSS